MANFSSAYEAVNWYEAQERVLTQNFLDTIPWKDIKKNDLDPAFVPVLLYMRDVEKFTELYYKQMIKSPTGRDPHIRRFLDKWSTEEPVHGDLLNRFLEESGYPSEEKWFEKAKKNIPYSNTIISNLASFLAHLVGNNFAAVHMTWGAINEASTLTGYRRLWEKANHPVLTYILKAIAREEAAHTHFYWSLAKLKLERSKVPQKLTNYIIKKFWSPVGQGAKREIDTNYVIRALFQGDEGVSAMDKFVTQRIELLPGMQGLKTMTERISKVALS